MTKLWTESFFGEEEFPTIDSEEFRSAPKKPKSFQKVVTKAVKECEKSKRRDEDRKKNVIMYRAPEHKDKTPKESDDLDKKLVSELLSSISHYD